MTDEELEELLNHCPLLYHMAERGSWPSIQEHGLLSTTALLDLYKVYGSQRERIEERRRPQSVSLRHQRLKGAVIRDQLPMDDAGLMRCLPSHMTPSCWYKILNEKVFFWLTRDRLIRLLKAGAYRDEEHDVLVVNARSLVQAHFENIWLCPINSGCTKPMPHPRDERTFSRVGDYPYEEWRQKRRKGERVVELAIDYAVPDIVVHTQRVVVMKGEIELDEIFSK